ncbi:MAG: nitrate reductase molybdenum cofactor assembly chaperone [Micrococcales bacterium]|nr:nitrate reductase molybdenum cofactor assembly chaperone [Micrococcales bacterium]
MPRPEPATPGQPGRCEVWALVSLCLGYPDDPLVAARSRLAAAAGALPAGQARRHLEQFTDWFAAAPRSALTVQYVRTFDMRRDTSLNLTYHSHGETRRRGLALLELKRRLRACGMVPEDGELPDHLPLLLEVAAVEPEHGADLLRLVRPGIEMLRRGLAESPYGHLLDALVVTLGPADTTTSAVVDELVVLGPPAEEVGTEPSPSCPGPVPEPLPFPRLRSERQADGPSLPALPPLGVAALDLPPLAALPAPGPGPLRSPDPADQPVPSLVFSPEVRSAQGGTR